jgi:hypothetical protein
MNNVSGSLTGALRRDRTNEVHEVSGSLTGTCHRDRVGNVKGYIGSADHIETLRILAVERAIKLKRGGDGLMDFSHLESDDISNEMDDTEEEEDLSYPPPVLVHLWEAVCPTRTEMSVLDIARFTVGVARRNERKFKLDNFKSLFLEERWNSVKKQLRRMNTKNPSQKPASQEWASLSKEWYRWCER